MAALTLLLPASDRATPPKHRMVIRTINGKWVYNAPLAPKEIDYEGFGSTWTEVPVPGRQSFLVKEGFALKKMSFEMIVADPSNPDADMTSNLRTLKGLADTTSAIKIAYGGYFDQWTWRCTNFTITSNQRHPVTSKITWATVQMEFTIKSDVADFVGPVTGGAKSNSSSGSSASKNATRKTPKKSQNASKKKATRIHVVKRGETLSGLAVSLLGDYSKWRYLADINNIKDPRKLPTGFKLKY